MKNIIYDQKNTPYFSGCVEYEYHDYLADGKLNYHFYYDNGDLISVHVFRVFKDENGFYYKPPELIRGEFSTDAKTKFNATFWKKLPLHANFDTGKWTRLSITRCVGRNMHTWHASESVELHV